MNRKNRKKYMNDSPWEFPPLVSFKGIDFGEFVPPVMTERLGKALYDSCVEDGDMHYVVKRAREAFRGVIAQAAARAICDGGLAGNPTEYSLAIENAVHRAVAKIFAESDKQAEIEPF
jgi:hypothetical protein